MVHMLSARHYSEFRAVPVLARFTMAQGGGGPEATLLIKASNLSLKYLMRRPGLRLMLFRIGVDWLAYGVEVPDDPDHPALLWSILEYEDELAALQVLAIDPKCVVFLFNEVITTTAWGDVVIELPPEARDLIQGSQLAPVGDPRPMLAMEKVFAEMNEERLPSPTRVFLNLPDVPEWHPIQSTYVTNRLARSSLSIAEPDEGGQQEEIGLWLIDSLDPQGAVKSPQIHEPNKVRELSDLLLSYEFGAFLIESKTLSILGRDTLPTRAKLTRDLVKHVDKATSQLIGGVKNLQRGYRITDPQGVEVDVNRTHVPHIIILVPDLSLLSEVTAYGGAFFAKVMAEVGGYFHILDPAELLRMVQVGEMIAQRNRATTPMMAFDTYLMDRAKLAVQRTTPNFGMIFRGDGLSFVENE